MKRKVIYYKGKVVFEKIQMSSQFKRFPKVFQKDEACFLYMSKGSFYFRTPTKLIEVNEGDSLVAKCGNYFIEQPLNQSSTETISVLGAYFYPKLVKSFFQSDMKLVEFKKNFDVSQSKLNPLMKSFAESISYLIDNPDLSDDNLILSKQKELLILLGKTEDSIHQFVNALFTPFEYDFKEVVSQNTYANLSQVELAKLCGCSLATFKRRFNKYFNQSPAKYFLQKKLEKSYQLLSLKPISISEIAYECGFENVTHFNKAFKNKYGTSPSQLRMSQKDNKLSF